MPSTSAVVAAVLLLLFLLSQRRRLPVPRRTTTQESQILRPPAVVRRQKGVPPTKRETTATMEIRWTRKAVAPPSPRRRRRRRSLNPLAILLSQHKTPHPFTPSPPLLLLLPRRFLLVRVRSSMCSRVSGCTPVLKYSTCYSIAFLPIRSCRLGKYMPCFLRMFTLRRSPSVLSLGSPAFRIILFWKTTARLWRGWGSMGRKA